MMKRMFARLFLVLLSLLMLSSCTASKTSPLPVPPSPKINPKQQKMAAATKALGEAYMSQGEYTAALKELLNAEKMTPNDPFLQNDLGLVYMAKNRFDLAETHFYKAVTLNPDYVPAKNNLGAAYLRQEKWDLAIVTYKEISNNLLYATPHYPLSNLGWAYLGKHDLKVAAHYFELSLKEQPDFINAIHGLATVYTKSGKYKSAVDLLKKGIKKHSNRPPTAVLHSDLAKIYDRFGRVKESEFHWRKVIELAPPDGKLAREASNRME